MLKGMSLQELDKQLLAAADIFVENPTGPATGIFNRFWRTSASREVSCRSSVDSHATIDSNKVLVRKQMKPLLERCPWLSDIQHLEDTVDRKRTWQQFEDDLALVLGIHGGGAAVRVWLACNVHSRTRILAYLPRYFVVCFPKQSSLVLRAPGYELQHDRT
jgi:hypothetical protein